MNQEEALKQLKATLDKTGIAYQSDSINMLLKSKYNQKPIYLFSFIQENGTMRVALSGEVNEVITDYSFQYIQGSLGNKVSSANLKNLHKSIINYCIGRHFAEQKKNTEYEKLNDLDFQKYRSNFLCDENGKYEFFTENCIEGKNELNYYGIVGFTGKSEDIYIKNISNLSSLGVDTDKYAIAGTFTVGGSFNAKGYFPETSFNVSQEVNYGFILEQLDGEIQINYCRRFSVSPKRWSGNDIMGTYLGMVFGPFEE